MNGPEVSIVLPVYNNAPTIGRALASVLLQEDCDFEVVVVNDSSTDDSHAILERFAVADHRVRVVDLTVNVGRAGARNAGLAHARGDLVAVMDADDLSLPNRLHCLSVFLREHSDIGWVSSWAYIINAEGRPVALVRMPVDPGEIAALLVNGRMAVVHAGSMMRRELVLALDGYRDPTPARPGNSPEDFDLARRFIVHQRIATVPAPLYAFQLTVAEIQPRRRRQAFWTLYQHWRDLPDRRLGPRFFFQLALNALRGYVPPANWLLGQLERSAGRAVNPPVPDSYTRWLAALSDYERRLLGPGGSVSAENEPTHVSA